jgi:hypothetical protein
MALAQGGGRPRLVRALLSAGLALWLGLQLLGGLWPHARGWPFVGFSMYTGHFQKDAIVSSVVMRRVTRGGRYVYAELRRMGAQDSPWQTIRPFLHADEETRRTRYLERYDASRGDRPKTHGLAVVAERYRLTEDGPVTLPTVVLGAVRRESSRGR